METWIPSDQTTGRQSPARKLMGLLGVFSALSAIFMLAVSVADWAREYAQKSWPEAIATVERCSVDSYIPLRRHTPVWYIECRIRYQANSGEIETKIQSRSTSLGWGGDTEAMHRWVAGHRPGSQIDIHYDPGDPKTAVLTATDMPDAGPRTPGNLRLLSIFALVFLGVRVISKREKITSGSTLRR